MVHVTASSIGRQSVTKIALQRLAREKEKQRGHRKRMHAEKERRSIAKKRTRKKRKWKRRQEERHSYLVRGKRAQEDKLMDKWIVYDAFTHPNWLLGITVWYPPLTGNERPGRQEKEREKARERGEWERFSSIDERVKCSWVSGDEKRERRRGGSEKKKREKRRKKKKKSEVKRHIERALWLFWWRETWNKHAIKRQRMKYTLLLLLLFILVSYGCENTHCGHCSSESSWRPGRTHTDRLAKR